MRRRALPTTCDLDLDTKEGVQRALDVLVDSGVVACFAEGPEAVYAIGPDQHLTAAYYRNTVIHFFVNGAIAELALLRAAEDDVADRATEFWDEAMRLRDLLKFEFFFAEKEKFRGELRQELALHDGEWESRLTRGSAEILALVERIRPFSAHRVLRPFLEAYRVVSDALERQDPGRSLRCECSARAMLSRWASSIDSSAGFKARSRCLAFCSKQRFGSLATVACSTRGSRPWRAPRRLRTRDPRGESAA